MAVAYDWIFLTVMGVEQEIIYIHIFYERFYFCVSDRP